MNLNFWPGILQNIVLGLDTVSLVASIIYSWLKESSGSHLRDSVFTIIVKDLKIVVYDKQLTYTSISGLVVGTI